MAKLSAQRTRATTSIEMLDTIPRLGRAHVRKLLAELFTVNGIAPPPNVPGPLVELEPAADGVVFCAPATAPLAEFPLMPVAIGCTGAMLPVGLGSVGAAPSGMVMRNVLEAAEDEVVVLAAAGGGLLTTDG
jgi:hypothetical protein